MKVLMRATRSRLGSEWTPRLLWEWEWVVEEEKAEWLEAE